MEPLHVAHLFFLATWGGLVLGETVVELVPRDAASARYSARVHYLMDLFIELPLLAGILVTGTLLVARRWPPTNLLLIKIACGLVAIGWNLFCVGAVIRREKAPDDAAVARLGRLVRASFVGVPFALVALYLGLVHFRG